MSADTIPSCAEGQTAASLSAWRDGALNSVEAERLRQHIEGCAACRERLAEYDAIADGLRAIHVPDPIGGYGRKPRLSPTSGHPRRLPLSLPSTSRLRIAGSLGAVAAVLLIALAFAQVFAGFSRGPGARRTPTATHATATTTVSSTPVALPPLSWHALPPLPDGIQSFTGAYLEPSARLFGTNGMIAPSEGTTAYVCTVKPPNMNELPTNASSFFFVTHDSGQTWSPILTISEEHDTTVCTVSVDALDPALVVASSAYAFRTAGPSPNASVSYVSRDSGIHWTRLPGDQMIFQPATLHGITYAIHEVQTGTFDGEPTAIDLAVSRDGMQTWTPIDGHVVQQSGHQYLPQQFWLNPSNGNLLLETVDLSNNDSFTLWHSEDAGAHWQPFGQPQATGGNTPYLVQAPAAGQPWDVCLAGYDLTGQGQNVLACTSDNGAEWTSRAALAPPNAPPAKGKGPGSSTGAALVFAIADDGAVLAVAAQGVAPDGSITGYSLFRLPAGASQWQSLGPVPEFSVLYVPAPGNGILWAVPATGIVLDPHNRVFTVAYP